MAEVKWTKEQSQAIHEKESNILVAAAAGSGKTAVLVERIINKIINEKIDIDRLLVVTFTNAAAAEMRERVLEAIYKKLDETPENENLQRQITLLNKASMCTIDSFCLDVVRNHFYELENISPNFRIADTTEIELLKQEVLEDLFEEKYENQEEDFAELINTYTSYRDDTPLKELILKIYTYIQSNPFPNQWLNEKIEMFHIQDFEEDFSKNPWGEILLKEVEEELIDDISTLKEQEQNLEKNPELEKYAKTIFDDIDKLEMLKSNLNSWDKAFAIYSNLTFATWPRQKVDSAIKDQAKLVRDDIKKKVTKKLNKIFIYNSEEANRDIADMYPILVKLKHLIFEFGEEFSTMTNEERYLSQMVYSGERTPFLSGGVSNTFSWNRFSASLFLSYSIGSKIRLLRLYSNINSSNLTMAPDPMENVRSEMVNRWKNPGDEKRTNIPGILTNEEFKNTVSYNTEWWRSNAYNSSVGRKDVADHIWQMYDYSDIRVVSGDYLKISTASIRYNVPEDFCKKIGMKSAYIGFTGTNLYTFCSKKLKGQDPTQSGSTSTITQSVRPTYSLTLNITL